MTQLVDRRGHVIAQAKLRVDRDDVRSFVLSDLRGKRSLLHHYCGCGVRAIWLNLGEVRLVGSLETQWLRSRRVWRVKLEGQGAAPAASRSPGKFGLEDGCGHRTEPNRLEPCAPSRRGHSRTSRAATNMTDRDKVARLH